jgi:hypothetical protein
MERCADALHDAEIEREIVDGIERGGERLAGLHEVAQVGARVAPTDGAGAGGIGRILVFGVLFVFDVEAAFAGEEQGVARGAGGEDAVHHVDAHARVELDLVGIADTHDIARFVARQERQNFFNDLESELARLSDTQATDGVAVEVHLDEALGALAAQVTIHASLHDAEERRRAGCEIFTRRLCYPRSQKRDLGHP